MSRIAIGDRVSAKEGGASGRVVDLDGDTAYILQDNGVELEFPVARLKPFEAAGPETVRTLSGPHRDRLLSPAHRALLASVPPELRQAVAKSWDEGSAEGTRPRFASLPDDKKLDAYRIYLPTLPPRLTQRHSQLMVTFRDLPKPGR